MVRPIKEFAEKVAEYLVVEFKFAADRAIAAVKMYDWEVERAYRQYRASAANTPDKADFHFGNFVVDAARGILSEMSLNMSSDYGRTLLVVRRILANGHGWDYERTRRTISTSHTILLKMVTKGYHPEAIVKVLVSNEGLESSKKEGPAYTGEPAEESMPKEERDYLNSLLR